MTTSPVTPKTTTWHQKGGEAANQQWHIWRAQHGPAGLTEFEIDLKEAFGAGFNAGARWSFVESARLAPAIADLSAFLNWLREAGEGPRLDLEELRAAWQAVKAALVEGWPTSAAFVAMDLLLAIHQDGTAVETQG